MSAVNGATFSPGKIGGALDLQNSTGGTNQHASVGAGNEINLLSGASAFTASAWFNIDTQDSTNTNHAVENIIFSQSANSGNDNIEMGIGGPGDNSQLYLDTNGGGDFPREFTPASPIQANTWHNIVWAYDSTDPTTTRVYLDGELAGLVSGSLWNGTVDSAGGNSQYAAGIARPENQNWGDFDGLIDDLAIFGDALTEAEAVSIYSLGDSTALNYDAGEAQQLFDLHTAGSGTVEIDGLEWVFIANGLNGGLGIVDESATGFQFALQLDGTGSGVGVAAVVPEPSSIALWSLIGISLAGFGYYRKRRKK